MAKIIVTDREGAEHDVEAKIGWSIMENVRNFDVDMIEAACGGACACATCHVYVDPAWADKLDKPGDDEEMMLDEAFEVQDNSRLSCQIRMTEALDGLKVKLAPEF